MTYVLVSSAFVAVTLVVLAVAAVVGRPDRRWWAATGLTLAALMVLTAVFDNLMIAVDLFGYVDDQISGLKIGLAPIEDFAWPVAAHQRRSGRPTTAATASTARGTATNAEETST